MTELLRRLTRLNLVPSRADGLFDAWLRQEDALNFLQSNAKEIEFVLYATFPHMFMASAMVPLSRLNPVDVDDLLGWNYSAGETWGFSSNDTCVELTPPLNQPNAKTLIGAEPLLFTRTFDGAITTKSYVEAWQ
jgi:hypothetical protein